MLKEIEPFAGYWGDKYDAAETYLNQFGGSRLADEMEDAWFIDTIPNVAHCLFQVVAKVELPHDNVCGCLTQLKCDYLNYKAETEELTRLIKSDESIPDHILNVKLSDIPTFKAWQRYIDFKLGRDGGPGQRTV